MQETVEEAAAKIPEDSINHESSTKTALITPINHGVMMDEDHATDPLVKNTPETANIEDVDINTSLNGIVTDRGDVIKVTKETMTPILKVEVMPTGFAGQGEHGNSNIQKMGESIKLAPTSKDKNQVIREKLNDSREQHVSVRNPTIVPPFVDPHERPPPPKSWKRRARMNIIAEPIQANGDLLVGGKRSA